MKKPTLRFRQVFEHPTHFKVAKPLGNPLIIAKKGLSPSLMGRLRKFATDGEVPEPTEQDRDNFNEMQAAFREMAKTAPEPREDVLSPSLGTAATGEGLGPEMFSSRVEPTIPQSFRTSVMQDASKIEDPAERAQFIRDSIEKYRSEEMFTTPRGIAATGEGLTIPERITKPAKLPAEIVPSGVFAQSAAEEPTPAEAPAARTRPRRLGIAAAAEEPIAEVTPIQPGQTTGRPKPGARIAAAEPTAEPVAEVEKPAEAPKPSPLEDALASINITPDALEKMGSMQRSAALAAGKAIVAQKALAEADLVAAKAEADQLQAQGTFEKKQLDLLHTRAKQARDAQEKILGEYDYLQNPGSYFSRLGTWDQIGTALSVAMGAFASGMTGMPNFAMKIYESAIDQDLNEQKRRADSLHSRLVAAGHTAEAADDLVKAQLKLVTAAEASRRAASQKLPSVKAKMDFEAAKLVNDATQAMARVAKDEQEMGIRAKEAPVKLEKLTAETELAKARPDLIRAAIKARNDATAARLEDAEQRRQDRIQKAADKAEQERIARGLTVGSAELELKGTTGAKDVRDNLAAREQAMMSVMKLESLFKKEGYSIFNPLSDARTEALEELATFIEQYPKAAGFKRAISLSAAKQLKEGLQAPAGGLALVKKLLGRDPTAAITGIRQEVQRSYANQVRDVVRDPQSDAVTAAIMSAYKKAEDEIKKYDAMNTADEEL